MTGVWQPGRPDWHDVVTATGLWCRKTGNDTGDVPPEAGVMSWLAGKEFGSMHAAPSAEGEPEKIREVQCR